MKSKPIEPKFHDGTPFVDTRPKLRKIDCTIREVAKNSLIIFGTLLVIYLSVCDSDKDHFCVLKDSDTVNSRLRDIYSIFAKF